MTKQWQHHQRQQMYSSLFARIPPIHRYLSHIAFTSMQLYECTETVNRIHSFHLSDLGPSISPSNALIKSGNMTEGDFNELSRSNLTNRLDRIKFNGNGKFYEISQKLWNASSFDWYNIMESIFGAKKYSIRSPLREQKKYKIGIFSTNGFNWRVKLYLEDTPNSSSVFFFIFL